jgi:hypothetical protein
MLFFLIFCIETEIYFENNVKTIDNDWRVQIFTVESGLLTGSIF